jgi:hypothetical protein
MRRLLLIVVAAATLIGLRPVPARAETVEAVLDSIQRTAFQYFWWESNATTGLIRDRSQSGSPSSIAAQGFGFTAIAIGIDHGWITRAEGAARVRLGLETLWNKPQGTATSGTIGYKGFYYHFLDMATGLRMTSWNTELSSIDTALLLAGVLDARQYFDGDTPDENAIRTLANQIYQRVDWVWMRNLGPGLTHGWQPNGGAGNFLPYRWRGYSEAMIAYILALGSPTFPIPQSDWGYWTGGYNWQTQYGQTYVIFPPLFGHQYSHCWIDFRGTQDGYMAGKGIDYFENSRRATLAQQAYCIANPFGRLGYGANQWGLTAGDGPTGYIARGAPPAPFAPEICLPTLQFMYDTHKPFVWGKYGFKDGYNLGAGWVGPDWIGIDQGPFIVMIENYLNGNVWRRFMKSPEIILGMQRAGFSPVLGAGEPRVVPGAPRVWTSANPVRTRTPVEYQLSRPGNVRLTVRDVAGRELLRLAEGWRGAGRHSVTLSSAGLTSGVYMLALEVDGDSAHAKVVVTR